ncbi:MAG: stage II sporulation protein P [Eubacteriales bacterium]
MEEKDPIPCHVVTEYDYNEIEPCVKAVPRKKKRKQRSFFKGIFYLFVCLALALLIYVNYDKLRTFTDDLLFGDKTIDTGSQNSNTDTPTGTDTGSDTKDTSVTDDTSSDTKTSDDIKDESPVFYTIIPTDMSAGVLDNQTSLKIDTEKLTFTKKNLSDIYAEYGKNAPVVLIIHSRANECYSDGAQYSESSDFYSDTKNVSDIGEIISSVLTRQGINCIHITDSFGDSLRLSKEKYEKTLSDTLKKYPSISYVIDLSRDITIDGDMSMKKPVIQVGDTSYAQLKITVGSNEITENPYWSENLAFALFLSEYISKDAKNLMRPCVLSRFSLSQQYAPLSLRIDVGSYSNTYEEASASGELLAYILASYITGK